MASILDKDDPDRCFAELECPSCGTNDNHRLLIGNHEEVFCTECNTRYRMPSELQTDRELESAAA